MVTMECGHSPNGRISIADKEVDACLICYWPNKTITLAEVVKAVTTPASFEQPLNERVARCGCGKEVPSSYLRTFFEYRGLGSRYGREICKNCHYSQVAHNYAPYYYPGKCRKCGGNLYCNENNFYCGNCLTKYTPQELNAVKLSPIKDCPGFEAIIAAEYDIWYCGCRGWD